MAGPIHLTKTEFSSIIEKKVVREKCTYIEAIVSYCANNNIEPETAAKMLIPIVKNKVEAEADSLNLLKMKVVKLPL